MKIATFNINDVNKRLANLIGWLRAEKPDVVALQELKFWSIGAFPCLCAGEDFLRHQSLCL